jgi:type VI secretion system protein ImpL
MTVIYIVLAVTVLALIGLLVFWLILRKKKKKAAEAEDPAATGDEVALLIKEAENKLTAAKLAEGGKVGNLPVFFLLGDSGSTKTSVMLRSGLEPELVAGQVYQNGNVIPTRTANLWVSRKTLFLEVGGTLRADPAKWNKLIKRLQPKTSVMGKGGQAPRAAMVLFDCENFTRPGSQEFAANAAKTLRARLTEISESLGINLPVYVLFTKLDRLPFFTEFVANLSNDESTQVVGVTLPMTAMRSDGVYGEQESARLTEQFERLFQSFADARPDFLGRETNPQNLPAAYEFPREFRKVRPALVQFLVDLGRPSQLTVGPFLRGFYFTGVRPVIINETGPSAAAPQPQQSSDYEAAAGATSLFKVGAARAQAQAAAASPMATARKVPQWLFLSHLFNDILLADKSAMGASGTSTRTSGARRMLLMAAAALCLLLMIVFTVSFFKNRGLEAQVKTAAQDLAGGPPPAGDLAPADSLRKLENLRQAVERLQGYQRDGAPLGYRMGLFVGDDLYPEARRIYFARFQQLLLAPTQAAMVQNLRALPPKPPGPDYNATYDELKAYLITTSNHDKSTKTFLPSVLVNWWTSGKTVDQERAQLARKQFDYYAGELKEKNPFSEANDGSAVIKGRSYLVQFAGTDRVYAFMLSEAAKNNPPINFNRQFADSAKVVLEGHEVPGAFTKNGWAFMKENIPHADRFFSGEEWVLGKQSVSAMEAANLPQEIRKRYNDDFLREWRAYIKSASVVKYAGLQDAVQKLTVTSGPQSPLLALFCLASQHTAVDDPAIAGVFQPVQAVVPPACSEKYIAPTNQNYMSQLAALLTSLDAVASQPQPTEAAAAQTDTIASQAKAATIQISQTFNSSSDLGPNVRQLLEDPITSVQGAVRGMGPAAVNKKGGGTCGEIGAIMAKYPFNPRAVAKATVQDINTVFKPKEGAIWQFYDGSLSKAVSRNGAPIAGAPFEVTSAYRYFLSKAGPFTDAAYSSGPDPKLTYSVRPLLGPDLERIRLTIDGQSADFAPNAPAKQFTWPGPAAGVSMIVRAKGGTEYTYPSYDGLWSIFDFIGDADSRQDSLVVMTMKAGKSGRPVLNQATGQPVTVRLEITANPPIFDKGFFSGLTCVSDVARVTAAPGK